MPGRQSRSRRDSIVQLRDVLEAARDSEDGITVRNLGRSTGLKDAPVRKIALELTRDGYLSVKTSDRARKSSIYNISPRGLELLSELDYALSQLPATLNGGFAARNSAVDPERLPIESPLPEDILCFTLHAIFSHTKMRVILETANKSGISLKALKDAARANDAASRTDQNVTRAAQVLYSSGIIDYERNSASDKYKGTYSGNEVTSKILELIVPHMTHLEGFFEIKSKGLENMLSALLNGPDSLPADGITRKRVVAKLIGMGLLEWADPELGARDVRVSKVGAEISAAFEELRTFLENYGLRVRYDYPQVMQSKSASDFVSEADEIARLTSENAEMRLTIRKLEQDCQKIEGKLEKAREEIASLVAAARERKVLEAKLDRTNRRTASLTAEASQPRAKKNDGRKMILAGIDSGRRIAPGNDFVHPIGASPIPSDHSGERRDLKTRKIRELVQRKVDEYNAKLQPISYEMETMGQTVIDAVNSILFRTKLPSHSSYLKVEGAVHRYFDHIPADSAAEPRHLLDLPGSLKEKIRSAGGEVID